MGKVEAEIAGGHRDRTGRITFQPPLLTDNVASLFPSLPYRDIIHLPPHLRKFYYDSETRFSYLLTYLLGDEFIVGGTFVEAVAARDKRQARLKLRNEKRRECY